MTTTSIQPERTVLAGGEGSLSVADLGEVIASFNEVTAKLERSHERLRDEVARLHRELGEANAEVERSRRLAALGEMAAGIAHEVRNPLGSIRLYARMLDEDLGDRPAERATVRKIDGAVRAIEGIVGDVLTFAREFRVRPERLDAGDAIARALEACRHDGVPGWRGVRVEVDADNPESWFEGDGGLVQQALVNVVRNAIEAMGEGGAERVLRVDARRVVGEGGEERVVVRVRDSGPGVSEEVRARMFNPFFTTRATGTGLGLAIVHRIMEAHGGSVSIRNNAEMEDGAAEARRRGVGACVELAFPMRAARSRASSKAA